MIVTETTIIPIYKNQMNKKPSYQELEEQVERLKKNGEELARTQKELEASKSQADLFFNTIPMGMVVIDAETHTIVDVNPSAQKLIGATKTEIVGSVCHRFICPAEKGNCPVSDQGHKITNSEKQLLTIDKNVVPIIKTVSSIMINGKEHYIEIFSDISQLKSNEEKLKNINHELELTNRQLEESVELSNKMAVEAYLASIEKSNFLASMGNDILSPMNGIIGMTELLADSQLDENQASYTQLIKSEADSLLELINDILDYSRIGAGKLNIFEMPFNLVRFIDTLATDYTKRAWQKGIELITFVSPEVPSQIIADPARLKQILIKFIGNAVKYTKKGEILIKCERVEAETVPLKIKFSVKDTGTGIPEDKKNSFFKGLPPEAVTTQKNYEGPGIGKAISKRISELMGGEIGVESMEGKGSTFWFTAVIKKQGEKNPSKKQTKLLSEKRILVAEENTSLQYVIGKYIESWGGKVEKASNFGETVTLIKNAARSGQPYHLVLAGDLNDNISGFELADSIKGTDKIPDTHVIVPARILGDTNITGEYLSVVPRPVCREKLFTCLKSVLETTKEDVETDLTLTPFEQTTFPLKVLVVEDYHVSQKIARKHLEQAGCRVDLVENGKEAVDAFQKNGYDIIFMDMHMPVMNGFEAIKNIRRLEGKTTAITNQKKTPIIALTASTLEEDIERCLQAGADGYLIKPLKRDMLVPILVKHSKSDGWESPESQFITDDDLKKELLPMDYAAAVTEFEGNNTFLTQVAKEFLFSLNTSVAKIQNALLIKDAGMIKKEAHTIHGGAANLLMAKLSEIACELESAAKSEDIQKANEILMEMKQEMNRVSNYLDQMTEGPVHECLSPAIDSHQILVVDDSKTMCRILKRYIQQNGISNVTTCKNGNEALQKMKHSSFDLIISDWNMPKMSGLELLECIRETDKNIPFVMITAETLTHNIKRASVSGVSDYICKPFKSSEIAEILQKYLHFET